MSPGETNGLHGVKIYTVSSIPANLGGYLWFSFKSPLKLLNKRLRPKREYCNNSVTFRLILMKLGMQPSYGPPFPLAKFQQGQKGQRPEGRKNFRKLAEAVLTII